MFNLKNSTYLADLQDSLFQTKMNKDIPLSKSDYLQLKNNLWANVSEILAPNNLVIRNHILLDYYENKPNRLSKILNLLNILTYNKNLQNILIYAEGYSYWLYIKYFLIKYFQLFNIDQMNIINNIDKGFLYTSYSINDILYPAPYSDVRLTPLENLQLFKNHVEFSSIYIYPITKSNKTYFFDPKRIGLNQHIPLNPYSVHIINNQLFYDEQALQPFKYYEGFNKKFNKPMDQIKDLIQRL